VRQALLDFPLDVHAAELAALGVPANEIGDRAAHMHMFSG